MVVIICITRLPFLLGANCALAEDLMADPEGGMTVEDLRKGSPMPTERMNCIAAVSVPKGEISTGTWACTAYTEKFRAWPVAEFVYLIEGEVHITT